MRKFWRISKDIDTLVVGQDAMTQRDGRFALFVQDFM